MARRLPRGSARESSFPPRSLPLPEAEASTMNRLYLLRHGIAVPPGTEGYEDDDRPLTSKGERRTRQVAQGLRRLRLKLDRIISSPLPRALRTAELVAETLDIEFLVET